LSPIAHAIKDPPITQRKTDGGMSIKRASDAFSPARKTRVPPFMQIDIILQVLIIKTLNLTIALTALRRRKEDAV
jgi:hypothetical protein